MFAMILLDRRHKKNGGREGGRGTRKGQTATARSSTAATAPNYDPSPVKTACLFRLETRLRPNCFSLSSFALGRVSAAHIFKFVPRALGLSPLSPADRLSLPLSFY